MQDAYELSKRRSRTVQKSVPYLQTTSSAKEQGISSTLSSTSSSGSFDTFFEVISEKAGTISESELVDLLNKVVYDIKHTRSSKRLSTLNNVIFELRKVRTSTLAKVAYHDFFTLLQAPFLEAIQQWSRNSDLSDEHALLFRATTKLLKILFKTNRKTDFQPSWLFESASLSIVAAGISDLSKPDKFLFEKARRESKQFSRLFDILIDYQSILNADETADKDTLFPLVDPVVNTLSSIHYTDSFDRMHNAAKNKMSKKEKFFLLKCPSFLLSYKGVQIDRMVNSILAKMIPRYIVSLNKLIPAINNWKKPTYQAVEHFLKIAELGSENAGVTNKNLPFIGHLLKMIDSPTLYNNLEESLSNVQSIMLSTIVNSLANVVVEPIVVDYFKQKKATASFIRLLDVKNESLQNNIYKIIAYIATEDDIKAIPHIDVFVSKVLKALKDVFQDEAANPAKAQSALCLFKSLVQHDQIKDELVKQNALPFLLELTTEHGGELLAKLLETIWSMSFFSEAASIIRSDEAFKKRMEEMSKTTTDEALRKASEGLVWKLIQEPAFLEKKAKQNKEENNLEEDATEITEVVIGEDGKETTVTKKVYASVGQTEPDFKHDMMISYCHADKEIVYKIHQFLLAQGFKIWIDLNNMFGPAMSAMAEAVESSEFVLLCMSPSYKQSTYCQAEAEYAFGCKRRLIPLIIQPNYKADGWLGFMIGSRIYIDFGFFDFDTACDKLMNEISLQRKRPLPSKAGQSTQQEKKAEPAPETKKKEPPAPTQLPDEYTQRKIATNFKNKPMNIWTEADVLDFLFDNRLTHFMPLCETMDGRALKQLYKMCESQTNETYNLLNSELQARVTVKLPIGIYTRFLSIMEQASKEPQPPAVRSKSTLHIYPMEPPVESPSLPYDIVITSNASAGQILKMAERALPRLRLVQNGYY